MFGSMFRDFDEDPFFSDIHSRQLQQMQRMPPMPSMFSPVASPFMALEGAPLVNSTSSNPHRSRPTNALQPFGSPFGMGFGSMFGNMNMMPNLQQNFEQMASDPNVHSYSHSSFTSYSSSGNGQPKVYQATSSTRKTPGGVKETKRSVRDTESGVQKMAIGHHLDDRAHIIERSQNIRTQENEEKQDFQNLDETDAQSFDQEWQRRTHRHHHQQAIGGSRHRKTTPYPALTNGRHNGTPVKRDRSPQRPKGPSHGGRHRDHAKGQDNARM